MKGKSWLLFIIPLVSAAVFTLLSFLTLYQNFENRVYDLFLNIRPAIEERDEILLLDIDDTAIDEIGVWPWSRHIKADGLILLREFNSRHVVFDIEYVQESPLGVNSEVLLNDIPQEFQAEFSNIQQNMRELFGAIVQGMISLEDAEVFIEDLTGLTQSSRDYLLERVQDIARDNDVYYGKTARLNGSAYFTVGMLEEEDPTVSDELESYVEENIALKNINVQNDEIKTAADIKPAILPIISQAAGAGFPNVVVDSDGVRRRIDILIENDGHFYPQLAFAPLLDWLGNPEIDVDNNSILLKGAEHPDKGRRNIRIPLTEEERVLINWPKATFEESFRHMTYFELVYNKLLEERLIENLRAMEEGGYLFYYEGDFELLEPYRFAADIKAEVLDGGDPGLMTDYAESRKVFFEELGRYLSGDAEQMMLGEIDAVLQSEDLDEQTRAFYEEVRTEVPEVFTSTRDVYNRLSKSRQKLEQEIPGSFIFIGWTGTSTTDIGVTPFEEEYMNVGTHASLINTILQENFLDELPEWYSWVLAFAFAFLVTFIIRKMEAVLSIIIGFAFIIVMLGADIALFVFTGNYLSPVPPLMAVFFTFVAITITKFLQTAEERTFIRSAFSHYLSGDVIAELINDPEKLSLGGQKKYITAMFTDVKGFSTISESLDPTELVSLLNSYLTDMSNIVLDQRGTIDKYEGDAIICFFGAPIEYQDHASRACRSAIRMKKTEEDLNRRFLEEKITPSPLFTRIGINTGDMVVGNMGTAQKMDYTIMGNSVNLASRLEGVNKQYGTWLLISEETYNKTGDEFTVRQMDKVRVVGIHKPVRLYELVDEKSATSSAVKEALGIFHQGLEFFELKEWEKAQDLFKQVHDILPEDGPSNVYIKRCNDFMKKPPPSSWDGVFNLTLK